MPIGMQPVVFHRTYQNQVQPQFAQPTPGQPTTTIFIGNISEKVPDNLIKQVLIKCGVVVGWKRVQDASGKMQAFGFCEYRDPDSTLRALRLLKDLKIADKELLVKVDQKTKDLLDEFTKKKRAKTKAPANEDGLDDKTRKDDAVIRGEIQAMINANKDLFQLDKTDPASEQLADKALKRITGQKVEGENEDANVNLDAEHASLVEREIRSFRDTYKDNEEQRPKKRERGSRSASPVKRERSAKPASPSTGGEVRRRSSSRAVDSRREDRGRRERSEERRRPERRRRSDSRDRRRRDKYDSDSDDNAKSRGRDRKEKLPDDEAQIVKKLDKKKKLRYEAFKKRFDQWEMRERQKRREYESYEDVEAERREEMSKERKRIAAFLEDYEDERDDEKYYRGSAFARRVREREREMEADERDRKKERDEMIELRRRLQEEYPDKDPDELIAKLNKTDNSSDENSPSPPSSPVQTSRSLVPNLSDITLPTMGTIGTMPPMKIEKMGKIDKIEKVREPSVASRSPSLVKEKPTGMKAVAAVVPTGGTAGPIFGFKMQKTVLSKAEPKTSTLGKRRKLEVSSVFNQDEEEDEKEEQARKKKLTMPTDDDKVPTPEPAKSKESTPAPPVQSAEDKRKSIKQLIDRIPTQKDDLFEYALDWSVLDNNLMERRVKPWINKKIVEYIGEEEPTLCGFICSKVLAKSPPQNILQDVAMVLDEEAEVFVVKMWRLLIYETEAKKLGLVK